VAGGEAVASYESVTDYQAAEKIINCAVENFGQLNILVNNAGHLAGQGCSSTWRRKSGMGCSPSNLKGTFNCSRHACAYWRGQHKAGNVLGGRIISTSSDAGLLGNIGQANYGAAKAAIAAFMVILSREMQRYDVTCNTIVPVARTRLTTDATPSMRAFMEATPPPGAFDMLDPENMAPLVAYLASDLAKDVTGQVFRLVGDKVWLLAGWHSVDMQAKKEKARWTPEELDGAVKELVKKAPPPQDVSTPFKEAGLF